MANELNEASVHAGRLARHMSGELNGQGRSSNSSDVLPSILLAVHPPAARVRAPMQKLLVQHGGESRQPQPPIVPMRVQERSDGTVIGSGARRSPHPTTPVFAKRRNLASLGFMEAVPARTAKPKMQMQTIANPILRFLACLAPPAVLAQGANAWVFHIPFLSPAVQDVIVALSLALAAKIWIKFWSELASRDILPSTLTRKLIHTGTGPMFVVGWAFFSHEPYAILAACAVPVINLSRLLLASREKSSKSEIVSALSRSGSAGEVARGPFYYTLVLLLATAFSFRRLPGAIAVCQMAVGDGLADIVGRRIGRTKWGFVKNKTVEGSVAFLLGAFASSLGMVAGANAVGYTQLTVQAAALPLMVISVACTLTELLSASIQRCFGDLADDNITVPVVGGLLAAIFLRSPYV